MKKKAFTLIEVIFAGGISAVIITIGLSVISLMTSSLYTGQVEMTYRSELSGCIFYLSREIQSAEKITVSDDGKRIEIKQQGSGKNIEYSFVDDYPVGFFEYEGKRLFAVKYDDCSFSHENNMVKINISVLKNNTDTTQIPKVLSYEFMPRISGVFE